MYLDEELVYYQRLATGLPPSGSATMDDVVSQTMGTLPALAPAPGPAQLFLPGSSTTGDASPFPATVAVPFPTPVSNASQSMGALPPLAPAATPAQPFLPGFSTMGDALPFPATAIPFPTPVSDVSQPTGVLPALAPAAAAVPAQLLFPGSSTTGDALSFPATAVPFPAPFSPPATVSFTTVSSEVLTLAPAPAFIPLSKSSSQPNSKIQDLSRSSSQPISQTQPLHNSSSKPNSQTQPELSSQPDHKSLSSSNPPITNVALGDGSETGATPPPFLSCLQNVTGLMASKSNSQGAATVRKVATGVSEANGGGSMPASNTPAPNSTEVPQCSQDQQGNAGAAGQVPLAPLPTNSITDNTSAVGTHWSTQAPVPSVKAQLAKVVDDEETPSAAEPVVLPPSKAEPPVWFHEARTFFYSRDLGPAWMACVKSWERLEKYLGYGMVTGTKVCILDSLCLVDSTHRYLDCTALHQCLP